jgi:hypothetical protein
VEGRYLGQLVPDMEICDLNGDKVGTVAHAHRYDLAAVGSTPGDSRLPHEEVLEAKTGFLGLGKHLYIPMSAIQDVIEGRVILSRSREDIEDLDWDEKPSYLGEIR